VRSILHAYQFRLHRFPRARSDALFVAIKGDRFDGHDFVDKALENGAVAALVSRGEGDKCVVVGDALGGLRDIGIAARERSRAIIVGVTGSVGKTTTKEAIRWCSRQRAKRMPRSRASTITGVCR
jgi:UDP-N-acetylmuramyl pentapeptide synthase